METTKCQLCGNDAKLVGEDARRLLSIVDCPACGKYQAPPPAVQFYQEDKRYIISAITRNHTEKSGESGDIIEIDYKKMTESPGLYFPVPDGPIDQIDMILSYIYRKSGAQATDISPLRDYPIAFLKGSHELSDLIKLAIDNKFLNLVLEYANGAFSVRLTWKALERLRELEKRGPQSNQAFVAMKFDDDLRGAWEEGICPALELAGYKGIRLDYTDHNDKIDDKQLAEIRKSSLLVADLTKNCNGVYFEAGFALGLNIPVIWTCRSDYLEQIHFDTRQYNYVTWEAPEDLKEKLKNRIEANYPVPRS